MPQIITGDRIGQTGTLRISCFAVIFDDLRERVLLVHRADNDLWALPGGRLRPGETFSEACIRETGEETGLSIEVLRLIGLYTDPHMVIAHKNGRREQLIAICFEARIVGGMPDPLDGEASHFGFYAPRELPHIRLLAHVEERIIDAFKSGERAAFD